jgi:hypothetical protein
MSIFKVTLNTEYNGVLDRDPQTGLEFIPSIQRSMYAAGPNGGVRELKDGEMFEDCNYWKQFTQEQIGNEYFITVITDDGVPWTNSGSSNYPLVSSGTIAAAGTAVVDYTLLGGYASFAQISNTGTNPMDVALNGAATATFPLAAGATQVFNNGDLNIGALVFTSVLGTNYSVIASVAKACQS